MILRLRTILIGLVFASVVSFNCSANIDQSNTPKTESTDKSLGKDLSEFNWTNVEQFSDGVIGFAKRELHIPGVAVSIVKDGKLLFSKGYGLADEKNKISVNPEITKFSVASISKTFTFTALMQLVEKGKISFDDHVAELLEFDEINQQFTPITVSQLMSHSAGFEESFLGSSLADSVASDTPLMQYIREFRQERVRPNGESIVYSNYGVTLAGAIIEKVTGIPFETYLQENVLSPLEMNNSVFADSKIPIEGDVGRAVGHLWTGNGYVDNRQHYLRRGNYPAGGLKISANDMAKFMMFHLSKGASAKTQVLKFETLQTMHTELKSNHPALTGNAHGFWKNDVAGYSSLEHDGVLHGSVSKMVMIPELNLGIFISTNSTDGYKLTHRFSQQLIRKFFPTKNTAVNIEVETDLSKYTGDYLMLWGNESTIEHLTARPIYVGINDGYLSAHIGFDDSRWLALENDIFVNEYSGEKIAFKFDSQGNALLFSHDMTFKKIGMLKNSKSFLNFCIFLSLLSLAVLLLNFIKWVNKANCSAEEKTFGRMLSLTALLWLVFIVSLFGTIISASNSLTPSIYVHFPNTATVIGQWVIIAVILSTAFLILRIKTVWKSTSWHWVGRVFRVFYIALLSLILIWSLEFNLIGFQY